MLEPQSLQGGIRRDGTAHQQCTLQGWLSYLPEEANDTVVQVGVAEAGSWNPDVQQISRRLRQKSLPLAIACQLKSVTEELND